MKIDNIIQRIERNPDLTPETKAKLIGLCQRIAACLRAIKAFMKSLIDFLRAHREFAKAMGIAILLAMIAHFVPLIGGLLSALILIAGLGWAIAADFKTNLEDLLTLVDLEKGEPQI